MLITDIDTSDSVTSNYRPGIVSATDGFYCPRLPRMQPESFTGLSWPFAPKVGGIGGVQRAGVSGGAFRVVEVCAWIGCWGCGLSADPRSPRPFPPGVGTPPAAPCLPLRPLSRPGTLGRTAALTARRLRRAVPKTEVAPRAGGGAPRHTRRGVAGAQALVVAACGCLLGVAIGMVPGIASTWPLTVRQVSAAGLSAQGMQVEAPLHQIGPVIVIPWWPLFGLVLLVPLLAAGLAWIAVRRHPQMTRRLA